MESFFKRYFKGDYVIWVIYVLLIMFSVSVLYSAGSSLDTSEFINHIIFLIVGFIALMTVYHLPREWTKRIAFIMLAFAFAMQVMAYTSLGSADHRRIFIFQPSELIKFALIVITAFYIDKFQNPDYLQKYFKWFLWIVCLPLILITPSNLSMGLIILTPIITMMMIGAVPWKKIGLLIGILIVVFIVACSISYPLYNVREDNNKRSELVQALADNNIMKNTFYKLRVHTWTNRVSTWNSNNSASTQEDIMKDEQAERAQCAIHDGKLTAAGPGNSFWRNHIEQIWSDYIFALIVEEYGLIGAMIIIWLFLCLLWRAGILVRYSETVYSSIVIVGAATVIILQAFVHIAVCTRLLPATGQPLPLISKGGTSILITSIFFGLLLRMSREVNYVEKKVVEKDNQNDKSDNDISNNLIFEDKKENSVEISDISEIKEDKNDVILEDFIDISADDQLAETTEIKI